MAGKIKINLSETTFEVDMDVPEIRENPVFDMNVSERKLKGSIDFIGVLYLQKEGGVRIRYKDGHVFNTGVHEISSGVHSDNSTVNFSTDEDLYNFLQAYMK